MRIETSSIAGRLVGEDDRRLDRERAGDRDALPLAAGELVRVLGRDLLRRHEADRVRAARARALAPARAGRCGGCAAAARRGGARS